MNNETRNSMFVMGKLTAVFLVGALCFVIVKIIGGMWPAATQNPEAMHLLVMGDFAKNFWLGEVFLAVLLPLFLVIISFRIKSISLMAFAGLCSLLGMTITYYDLVIVGQLIPHFHEYNVVGLPQYYSYSPSLHEYMITMGSVCFFLMAVVFGEMAFNTVTARERRILESRHEAIAR